MATIQINISDEVAQKAASAGLLTADAMEAMLREQLRRRAGETLQAMWQRGPQEELTPEVEQEIVEEVRKVRAAAPASQEDAAQGTHALTDQQQALFDKIMQLPPQRIAQVVDFIDFLRARHDKQRLNPAASPAGGGAFTTDDPVLGCGATAKTWPT